MQTLVAAGEAAKFVELSPGRTLAGLAKRINRRLPVESVETLMEPKQTRGAPQAGPRAERRAGSLGRGAVGRIRGSAARYTRKVARGL